MFASRHPQRAARTDTGGAVVEATLVGMVLSGLFLAILQLGLTMHVRNTLIACAADGARYAANANRTPEEGAEHARRRIRAALSDSFAQEVKPVESPRPGVVGIEVTARMPLFGYWGIDGGLQVRGHAFDERGIAPQEPPPAVSPTSRPTSRPTGAAP